MTPVFKEQLPGADPAGGFGRQSWTFHARLTRDQIDRARRWLIVAGSLALVIGIVSIAVPVIASVTAAIFVGWVLVASGVAVAIHISHRAPVRGIEALIALVAGFYLLVFPLHGTVTTDGFAEFLQALGLSRSANDCAPPLPWMTRSPTIRRPSVGWTTPTSSNGRCSFGR